MAVEFSRQLAYPPAITRDQRSRLVDTIKDWASGNGLTVRPPPSLIRAEQDPDTVLTTHVPVTLFPSPFPSNCFDQAHHVQKAYNELYANIGQDEVFLAKVVKEVASSDDFIARLWSVHERVKEEGYVQAKSLGLFRSDYMIHQETGNGQVSMSVKQVEFNTIASSFGGLSTKTSELHSFLARNEYPNFQDGAANHEFNLPSNTSTQGLAQGLVEAYNAYGPSESRKCIIFLTQDSERNIFDQRHLEYAIYHASPAEKAIAVFRLPFSQILQRTQVDSQADRRLLYTLPSNQSIVYEVAVVYMRSGYDPSDYPDESAWDARFHLERSKAIKCPTVLTQLAGTKKVQQVLATPEVTKDLQQTGTKGISSYDLGHFVPKASPVWKQLWDTFTNIYPLDSSAAGLEARKLALDPESCKRFVLKPQREGGGNNTYKSAIPAFLKSLPESHWQSYILMELITPPPVSNLILRNGKVEEGGVICELGVYGTCLWDAQTKQVLWNEDAGYLLRTKGDQSEEGGVAAGFGCMDSCNLI